MKQYRFLDLSGYMFSGKAAAIDLIREFKGYDVPNYRYEFPLIRIQDGIMDLEKALVDDWSPIRSDVALKRFLKLTAKMANRRRKISLKEEELVAWGFDEIYAEKFREYSEEYAESLVDLRTRAAWPYYELAQSFYELSVRLLLPRIKGWKLSLLKATLLPVRWGPALLFPRYANDFRNIVASILDPLSVATAPKARNRVGKSDVYYDWPVVDLTIPSGEGFYEKTQSYLEKLLSIAMSDRENHTIVMHNAFEPFNPWRAIKYFGDVKCIVVDRDPRDIYVTSRTYSKGFNDDPNVNERISFSYDVDLFIRRFMILRKNSNISKDPPGRVLRIRFEDLVMDYANSLQRIYDFLGENESTHEKRLQFFDPSVSRKNVGLWKSYPNQGEIEKIRKALESFCYDS